ncbi:PTS system, mannitol-specific IIC component [Tetragenococcus halophilus subsp. halophilus]|uniref:PTS mannitol transporter subunit IICB n=1 Tax=Tetragenococcus halophilus TaxID=51669 RepID=UPI000CCB0DAD|nr:PTS mannitol transporter subunit IICB [Tetragenococcus halophilus]GBD73777.1 PTS system, mannitol-specific IIC component [Tetragenococcus halophilus subsp. halophilus]GBD76188.1 PTS system, mannitol-specific IIC component [Tetragenococcus halophilus subsp. halophilus]GBD80993.1 PTS system, mannitol-specific IIC component [Tetragenococcus halophilus subsp. halophilus]GFK21272.1 mannitol-specific PTS system IIBC component [Tetragenococcus halophilus]GMQ72369.1 PTS mannitol transporter subunit
MSEKKTEKTSIRAKVQAFGGFLSNMVMPNIGAFIAWGIATALFIPTGWLPNETLNELVDPTITYLLPLLLAYTGGRMIGGDRGAVLGAIGTIGIIIGADIPMFLGAMIIGPLGGWLMKKTDKLLENRIPAGFEMVVNNFSIGIIGFLLMVLSYTIVGPIIEGLNTLVTNAVEALVATGFLPLLSLINEPAKVLFLNNVIDQGIYYPLGMQQTLEVGKSIYFMVASNPGPGLGLLLAFTFFGKKTAKRTAPGAIIIHFLGGIHEMYFPYVLMKPLTIISMIAGGMAGTATFQIFNSGLVAGPSPGSILAYLALTPRGNFFGVILGVLVGAAVSFIVTMFILKADKTPDDDNDEELETNIEKTKQMKSEGKNISNIKESMNLEQNKTKYEKISFACDAGMGSSAMGATTFKRKLQKLGVEDVEVKNYRIEDVPEDSDIIVVHKDLEDRTKRKYPNTTIITLTNYLQDPKIDELADEVLQSKS